MEFYFYLFAVFLAVNNGRISSVHCQYEIAAKFHQNYNLENSILKSVNYIGTSESMERLSEDDRKLLKAFPNFVLPIPLSRMLRDVLSESASSKCGRDLDYVFDNIFSLGLWPIKMLDSYGKPESGILSGNLNWIGEYDECLGIYAPATVAQGNITVGDFHGKYCTLRSTLKFGKLSLPLALAVCLPDSCDPKGTQENNETKVLHSIGSLGNLGSLFSNASITCKSTTKKITAGAVIVALILSIILLLAVIGSSITIFEYFMNVISSKEPTEEKQTSFVYTNLGDSKYSANNDSDNAAMKQISLPDWLEKVKPFFNCFCVFTNGEKLLNTDSSQDQLPCLHGIRFLSMTWIIMCHSYMTGSMAIKNVFDYPKFIEHWIFQIVLNGFFSVDSFFLLSGFLVAYVFFKQAEKTDGKIPWLYFYIHRYVRLTPVYLMVLLFNTFVYPYMGSGPLWSDDTIDKPCSNTWWWNLLYINNFVDKNEQCLPWAWYLADDMQFYIISPLFLITLWRWPIIGYSVIGVFFSINFITNFVLTLQYNLIAGLSNLLENPQDMDFIQAKVTEFFDKIYYKPYARVGPYLVGILLAYVLHKRKKENAVKLNKIYLTVGWIFASGLTLTCQFGLYHQNLNKVGAAFYNAFSRTIFGLGLGWIMFVCIEGQAETVNRILSWKPLIPLSRLTFCAYMIHPMVQMAYFTSLKSLIYFTHTTMFMMYLAFLVISYAVALLVSLLLESPVIRLERLLRNKLATA